VATTKSKAAAPAAEPAATAADTAATAAAKPTIKIVIVSGQEFQVPIESTVDELRQHLTTMFPDVASATVQHGKKKIDGVEYPTIEFVKRAGTKGATGDELLAILAQVPAVRLDAPPGESGNLIAQVCAGHATIGQALDGQVLARIAALPRRSHQNGGLLCSRLDDLSPVPVADPPAW
jgi:hypothetical protein